MNWVSLSQDLKFFCTGSTIESIIWDTTTCDSIAIIDEKLIQCVSSGGFINGLFHEGQFKKWSEDLISTFNSDFVPSDK